MTQPQPKPSIMFVDHDPGTLAFIERILTANDMTVYSASDGLEGMELLLELYGMRGITPDLILVEAVMPGMDGYELCARVKKNPDTASIPIIFLSDMEGDKYKSRAFSLGAVDYLLKPVTKEHILKVVKGHMKEKGRLADHEQASKHPIDRILTASLTKLKEFLSEQLEVPLEKIDQIFLTSNANPYTLAAEVGINNDQMAEYLAEFFKLPYLAHIESSWVRPGIFPPPYCKKNHVASIHHPEHGDGFAIANPFNHELLDVMIRSTNDGAAVNISIASPESIRQSLIPPIDHTDEPSAEEGNTYQLSKTGTDSPMDNPEDADSDGKPVIQLANTIFEKSVREGASDIHISPKETNTLVRIRVNGDMKDIFALSKKMGMMLISRFKVLAGMDIAERRKPQDGALEVVIADRNFKLRLATTSTVRGESMVIRLLEPRAKARTLQELGMTERQARIMMEMGSQTQGLILVVGPTGAGKTTTIFSLLSAIDCQTRSLITVEDPIEYRIPFATQQQVNEKRGVTFENLLKSVLRQDPDILFLGEIRDLSSAKIAMDFTSTGHLTITTIHASNATAAIFRFERLGINRGTMAESILGVVAQRLVKKLCPHCKKVVPISQKEIRMLSPYEDKLPTEVAQPTGCPRCKNTGYLGREGVYEILYFDPELSRMIRSDMPIADVRRYAVKRGDFLMARHALHKVKNLLISPQDAYQHVLMEDTDHAHEGEKEGGHDGPADTGDVNAKARDTIGYRPRILMAEDDLESQRMLEQYFHKNEFELTFSADGFDALMQLGKTSFDIIIADVDLPNMDGFKLLEVKTQKGIDTPLIFLTASASDEDETRGLELGAADYIRMPIKKELLLLRVNKVLQQVRAKNIRGSR